MGTFVKRMSGFMHAVVVTAVVAAAACSNNAEALRRMSDAALGSDSLAVPAIPAAVVGDTARADYFIGHFWDNMDFADTVRSLDRRFMRDALDAFVSEFPNASPEARDSAVDTLMSRALVAPDAFMLVAEVAEELLYEPESPRYNEWFFVPFLECVLSSPLVEDIDKERYRFMLDACRLNRPGSVAPDFEVIDRSGRAVSFHRMLGKRGVTIVVFYDPECETCHHVMSAIERDDKVRALLADGRVTLIAVYPDDDRELWDANTEKAKAPWKDAFAVDDIQERGDYLFRAIPTVFLLSGDATVLMKDPSVDALLTRLQNE